jgi:hypothetical protein
MRPGFQVIQGMCRFQPYLIAAPQLKGCDFGHLVLVIDSASQYANVAHPNLPFGYAMSLSHSPPAW